MDTIYETIHEWDVWFAETFHAEFNETSVHWLATKTPELPLAAVSLYLVMVYLLPKILPPLTAAQLAAKKKQPKSIFDSLLAVVVPLWDLGLSLFSLMVLIGVGLPYYRYIQQYGLATIFCDKPQIIYAGSTPLKYWSYLFALSKYYELADTLFLVLKRKPIIFLHWYHHCTVLLFTWFAEYWRFSMAVVFILVNAFVHTVMYFYYFMSGLHVRFPDFVPLTITILQITQMFVGIGTNLYWAYLFHLDSGCACEAPYLLMTSAAIMYGSYLFLFLQFFFNRYRYLWSGAKAKPAAGAGAGASAAAKKVKARKAE